LFPFNQWRGWGGRAPGLKKSGQILFSGQAQVAQKSCKVKNISIQKNFRFSGQEQVAQNSE